MMSSAWRGFVGVVRRFWIQQVPLGTPRVGVVSWTGIVCG